MSIENENKTNREINDTKKSTKAGIKLGYGK